MKGKILVVDDDDDILILMQHKLAAEGFKTLISPNGENMMDIITHDIPDLILLDIHMDGIDGGTICQMVKSNASTAKIPIIMFSANENIMKITEQCGADGFIRKPFNGENFSQAFEEVLAHRH